jgi:biotin transport system substrate-specific component
LFFLGGRRTTVCVLLYLFIGSVGLPVFSGFRGGVSMLLDATGGYLFGFLFASLLFWLLEAVIGKNKLARFISSLASLMLLYAIGSMWYSVVYLGGLENILSAILSTVLPFTLFDVVKIALAYIVSVRISLVINIK